MLWSQRGLVGAIEGLLLLCGMIVIQVDCDGSEISGLRLRQPRSACQSTDIRPAFNRTPLQFAPLLSKGFRAVLFDP